MTAFPTGMPALADGSMSINLLYNENDLDQRAKDLAETEMGLESKRRWI